jgi:hypothetical protein
MRQIVHFCLVNLEPIERTEEALPSAYIPTGTNEVSLCQPITCPAETFGNPRQPGLNCAKWIGIVSS